MTKIQPHMSKSLQLLLFVIIYKKKKPLFSTKVVIGQITVYEEIIFLNRLKIKKENTL